MMKATVLALCVLTIAAEPWGSLLKLDSSVDQLSFTAARDQELDQLEQDPCAGCVDSHVVSYQKCMSSVGSNPCTKQYTGVAFDNGCCVMKEKHGMCLRCKSMGARPHYNSKWTDQQNLGVTVYEH